MNIRALLTLIATILWFLLGYLWFNTNCPCNKVAANALNLENFSPLVFNHSSINPLTNSKLNAYVDSLLAGYNGRDTLEITGYYYADEPNTSSFQNMGLARADEIRKLLVSRGKIDSNRVKLSARNLGQYLGDTSKPFKGAAFQFLTAKDLVEELADRTIIYFPYNSTVKIDDPQVENYLERLAEKMKTAEGNVFITGHTDNIGGMDFNKKLGLERANAIKTLLASKGVDAARIKTSTKWFSDPVAPNDNDEGRSKNRRAELTYQLKQ